MADPACVSVAEVLCLDSGFKILTLLCLQLEEDLGLKLTPAITTIRDHARTLLALGLVETP